MATQPHHRYTLAEYADLDAAADVRGEYLDGAIYAMASSSPTRLRLRLTSPITWATPPLLRPRSARSC
jgi:Uma2 family endonuclease